MSTTIIADQQQTTSATITPTRLPASMRLILDRLAATGSGATR